MSDNFTNSTLLIRYMDKELFGEELVSLEERLAQDKNLQEELENLQNARLSITGLGLRNQIGLVHKEMMSQMKKDDIATVGNVRRLARISLRVAAGILVLLLAGATYQYVTISPEKLFTENYSAYTIGTSRTPNELPGLEKAIQEKDYKSAISLFNKTPDPGPKEFFLAGNAYLALDDITNAILYFNKCVEKNEALQTSTYLEDAEYYLAISYLKNKEVSKALPLFEKIHSQPLHLYHDKVSNWFIQKVKVAGWKQ